KAPEDRYATATAISRAYSAVLRGQPLDDISDEPPVDRDAPTLLDLPLNGTHADNPPVASPLSAAPPPETLPQPKGRARRLPLLLVSLLAIAVTAALALDLPG